MLLQLIMCECTFCRFSLHALKQVYREFRRACSKPMKFHHLMNDGIGIAFITMPKRSVTGKGNLQIDTDRI